MSKMMKLRYEKLRQVIGRDFVIEQVIRKYFPNPQTETKLIDISRTVSKYATNALKPLLGNKKNSISPKLEIVVIPEDICLFVFGLFFFPFVYLSMKTGLWLWFVEIYACFIIPTLNSIDALEAGKHEKSGHFFFYWVTMVGMMRVIETIIDLRSMFSFKYVILKSVIALALMHPKTEGIVFLSEFLVEGIILPALGLRQHESRKVSQLETLSGFNDDYFDSDPSLINPEEDNDEWKDSKNEIDDCLGVTLDASSDEDGCVKVKEVKASGDMQLEKIKKEIATTEAVEEYEQNELKPESSQTKEVDALDNTSDDIVEEPTKVDNKIDGGTNTDENCDVSKSNDDQKKDTMEKGSMEIEMVNQYGNCKTLDAIANKEKEAVSESSNVTNLIEDKQGPSTSSSSSSTSDFSYVEIGNESSNLAQGAAIIDDEVLDEKDQLQSDEVQEIYEVSGIVTPVKTNTKDNETVPKPIDEKINEDTEGKDANSNVDINVPN